MLHVNRETPAAWWRIHMVHTCGIVIRRVKIDMPPEYSTQYLSPTRSVNFGITRMWMHTHSPAAFASDKHSLAQLHARGAWNTVITSLNTDHVA